MTPFPIFIGCDSREAIAAEVLRYSIERRASRRVAIYPLRTPELVEAGVYTRQRGPLESTEFSFTRFLVPFLCAFRGPALFLDCDMLCRVDIGQLLDLVDGSPVQVCQHQYVPWTATKFLGQPQTAYPRKNWSSLMLFDCGQCRQLTPEYVNSATGLELHRLLWADGGDGVGRLPLEWNWLVGEYAANPDAKMWHYTLGGPWFPESANCDHAAEWLDERDRFLAAWAMNGELPRPPRPRSARTVTR